MAGQLPQQLQAVAKPLVGRPLCRQRTQTIQHAPARLVLEVSVGSGRVKVEDERIGGGRTGKGKGRDGVVGGGGIAEINCAFVRIREIGRAHV